MLSITDMRTKNVGPKNVIFLVSFQLGFQYRGISHQFELMSSGARLRRPDAIHGR